MSSFGDVGEADLARLLDEAAEFDILLVGTGDTLIPMPPQMRRSFREAGVAVETMATGAAVRTYNVLLAEDRTVAAALIAVD